MEKEEKMQSFEEAPLNGTIPVTKDKDIKLKKRETWTRKIDFLVACCGFSIGLGNVWKFPFLCYRNGGGAFLIPYFLCCFIGGIPTFFLEVSVGQFMSEGGMGAWKICPLFQGIGVASAIIMFLVCCDYNVLLSWAFYYFFSSFTAVLPWAHCDNEWNTPECTLGHREGRNDTADNVTAALTSVVTNVTSAPLPSLEEMRATVEGYSIPKVHVADPVTEFWDRKVFGLSDGEASRGTIKWDLALCMLLAWIVVSDRRKVLGLSDGVASPGTIKWDLALCLLLAWIVVYFCIWKGIKGSGKVMYFTVPAPYVLMLILLVRGATLEGAIDGIKFYLVPDFSKLLEFQVWADAGNQVFYSYSLSQGVLAALGSYNTFHHNSYRHCAIFAGMNSFTSLLSGFVIFPVLGFMANKQNVSVEDVAEAGPGLAFIAYPEAVAQMPVAPLWSCLFFLMIILLGLDSQFVAVEGVVTFVVDLYPHIFRRGYRREIMIAVMCAVSFLVGLSMVCEGGMYIFQLFDYYSVSRTIFVIAFMEMIVISYVYGVNRHYDNLTLMFGRQVTPAIKVCWAFLTPLFIFGLFILGTISYAGLTYDRKSVTYHFPNWAIAIGWLMAVASIVWIPIIAVYRLWQAEGTLLERFQETIKPVLKKHQINEHEDIRTTRFQETIKPVLKKHQINEHEDIRNVTYIGEDDSYNSSEEF